LREERIDLVHASGTDSLLFASLGARKARVPFVWNVFDPLTGLSPRKFLTARRHVTARLLGSLHPDAVIFGTDRAAEGTPRRHGTLTAKILPGIDLARYGQGDGPRARHELGIPDGAPVLAMFGRLTFLKSQTDFVRAMAEVTRVVPNAYGVICGGEGESTYGDHVRSLRHELGLEGQVFVTGFVPDQLKDDIMAAADVVVHLAKRESFGLAVVEAQASGKAVVAADASGPRSLIDDGVTGMVVPVGDIDRLAEVLIDLLHRPERRAELGLQARATSLRHGIEPMVEQIEAVWDLVLDDPAA
jgi:D-inositol-3-phosphate glycosyltransferase